MLDYARLSGDYARYHRTEGNKRAHSIGIPLIVFAVVRWSQVGTPFPLAALLLPIYFLWDRRIGWAMAAFTAACAGAGALMPLWTGHAAFVVGWVFQFYGHWAHEKNSPALLDNMAHALVGPAFIAERALGSAAAERSRHH